MASGKSLELRKISPQRVLVVGRRGAASIVINPGKDRTLPGKKRRQARKAARR